MTSFDPARIVARSLRHYVDDHENDLTQAERQDLEHARRILERKQRPTEPVG